MLRPQLQGDERGPIELSVPQRAKRGSEKIKVPLSGVRGAQTPNAGPWRSSPGAGPPPHTGLKCKPQGVHSVLFKQKAHRRSALFFLIV